MRLRYDPQPWEDLYQTATAEHPRYDDFWRERDCAPLLGRARVPMHLGCPWDNVALHLPVPSPRGLRCPSIPVTACPCSAPEHTVLVTGATDGLGRGLAEHLAARGATVLLHGRSRERLRAAATEIREATGSNRLRTYLADLASLDEVRSLASAVEQTTESLDVLVSNAGIGTGKPDLRTRQESRDGYELRFAVNYLAGFLLTLRLLPLLRRSAPARVVYVASLGQSPIDFDDVMLEHGYTGARAYTQSKLAQVMSGFELAERLPAEEVSVLSLHPGTYMPTKIVLQEIGSPIDTLETGVAAVARLATSPELAGVTGRYFDRQEEARANAQAYDRDARRRLWDLSLRLTGESEPRG